MLANPGDMFLNIFFNSWMFVSLHIFLLFQLTLNQLKQIISLNQRSLLVMIDNQLVIRKTEKDYLDRPR